MGAARLTLADSGGVQEESTVLGVRCLTLRTTTERPVTIAEGANRLVELYDAAGIVGAVNAVLAALVAGADAVVSAGGSMNREAAVLGTPARRRGPRPCERLLAVARR